MQMTRILALLFILGTDRWTVFNENVNAERGAQSAPGEFWFSEKEGKVYAMSLAPAEETVRIRSFNNSAGKVSSIRLLGSDQPLIWAQTDEALEIDFAGIETGAHDYAIEVRWE